MVEITKVKGLFAAVFTPFDENNEVNLKEIPKYGKYLADNKVKGVLVNGTIGEGTSLTFDERKAILQSWVDVSKTNNLSVFVQVGGTNLKQVKELAKHAESLKVSGIVCLPDLFFKPKTAEELVFYMQAVSQSAPKTPLFYYHTPSFTGVQVDMRRFLEIASKEIPTLAGIKFSHPVLGDALRCLPVNGGKYSIIHGYDQILSAAFTMGIDSVMITSLNFAPSLVRSIHEHIQQGRNNEALKIERKLMMLTGFVLNMGSWTAGYKAVTSIITGINLGNPRSPLKPLSEMQLEKLKNELKDKSWLQ